MPLKSQRCSSILAVMLVVITGAIPVVATPGVQESVINTNRTLRTNALQIATGEQSPNSDTHNSATAKEPIKIGILATLTGPGAISGQQMVHGLQLYFDQINNEILKRPVRLLIANDQGSPAIGRAAAHKLMCEDKVSVLTGIVYTPVMNAIAPLAESYKTPVVCAVSCSDDITQRKRGHWIIRTSCSSSQASNSLGEYAAKVLHYKNIVTLATDYQFGWEVVGGFQRTFEENGGHIVQKIWVPFDSQDFSQFDNKIDKSADAIFLAVVGSSAVPAVKSLSEAGRHLPKIGSFNSFDEEHLQREGDAAIGCVSAAPYSADIDSAVNRRFVAAYREKFGETPGFFAECGYSAAMCIGKAIQTAQNDVSNPSKLMQCLRAVELSDAPRGPIRLDNYGSPVENIYIRQVKKLDKRFANSVIYTYPMVSQFWKYKPDDYLKQPPCSRDYPPCKYCSH